MKLKPYQMLVENGRIFIFIPDSVEIIWIGERVLEVCLN